MEMLITKISCLLVFEIEKESGGDLYVSISRGRVQGIYVSIRWQKMNYYSYAPNYFSLKKKKIITIKSEISV